MSASICGYSAHTTSITNVGGSKNRLNIAKWFFFLHPIQLVFFYYYQNEGGNGIQQKKKISHSPV